MNTMQSGNLAAYSLVSLYTKKAPPIRNLGLAIVVVAITDYRGRNPEAHLDAARFLFPETDAARAHYEWAVALQTQVNAEWLREALDRARPLWDEERKLAAERPRRKKYAKRIRLDRGKSHDWPAGVAGALIQPAHAAGAAGAGEAAPGL